MNKPSQLLAAAAVAASVGCQGASQETKEVVAACEAVGANVEREERVRLITGGITSIGLLEQATEDGKRAVERCMRERFVD